MSIKNIQTLTAVSTGTLNVNVDQSPSISSDNASIARVSGTVTLSGNLNISPTGTPSKNTAIKILWEASVTPSGNSVVIFGETVPDELVASNFIAECIYDGSAWVVNLLPDFAGTGIIAGKLLGNDTISTSKIIDDAVTNDKLANITRGSVKVGGASDAPTDLDAKTSGNILVGDGTDIASVAVSGDATLSSLGALTIANSAVTTAKIDDDAVTAAKLDDDANRTQIVIPVSFESAGEIGAVDYKICFPCVIEAIHSTVTKTFVSTGTQVFKDNSGTVLTGSQIDMSSALLLGNIVSSTPTANNTFAAGDVIRIETSVSGSVGGKCTTVLCALKV